MELYDQNEQSQLELALLEALRGRRTDLHQLFEEISTGGADQREIFFQIVVLDTLQVFCQTIARLTKENLPYWGRADAEVVKLASQYQLPGSITSWRECPFSFDDEQFFPSFEGKPARLRISTTTKGDGETSQQDEIRISRILCDAAFARMPLIKQSCFLYVIICLKAYTAIRTAEAAITARANILTDLGFPDIRPLL